MKMLADIFNILLSNIAGKVGFFQQEISGQVVNMFSPQILIFVPIYFAPDRENCCKMNVFLLLMYRTMYQYFGKMKMLEPLGLEVINGECLG